MAEKRCAKKIVQVWNSILKEVIIPRESWKCGGCSYRSACNQWKIIHLHIMLPPLKERIEDFPYLAEEFIKRHREEKRISGISQKAIEVLGQYHWPGNVRQLENVIIRAVVNTQNEELWQHDIQFAIEQEVYAGYEIH